LAGYAPANPLYELGRGVGLVSTRSADDDDISGGAFKALDPFFNVIQQGLAGFVDGEQFFDTIADDAIFEFLYTAPGWPQRIDGHENLMAIFSGYGKMIALRSAHELVVHKSQDPRVVVLEYAVHGTVLRTGLDYNNHFIP
jgi:uncharacterized protein